MFFFMERCLIIIRMRINYARGTFTWAVLGWGRTGGYLISAALVRSVWVRLSFHSSPWSLLWRDWLQALGISLIIDIIHLLYHRHSFQALSTAPIECFFRHIISCVNLTIIGRRTSCNLSLAIVVKSGIHKRLVSYVRCHVHKWSILITYFAICIPLRSVLWGRSQ